MLLSDVLLEIGMAVDKNDWSSKSKQSKKMLDVLILAKDNGTSQKKLLNMTKLVVNQLNKAGLLFYNVDMFWMKTANHKK